MKLSLFVGVVAVALTGMQAALANQIGVPSVDERGENRQFLIGLEGATYNPTTPTHVLSGPAGDLLDTVVTLSEAIELQLDQLEEHGVRLADVYTASSTSAEPEWPLIGQIQFHEKGWYQMGARCPDVEALAPSEVEDIYDILAPGDDDRLGTMTTDVSEFSVNEFGQVLQSNIQYWTLAQNHETDEPTGSWWYTGWTIEAEYSIDYFCREPLANRGQVQQESFVVPFADRVDD